MLSTADATEDPAVAIAPPIVTTAPWRVKSVSPLAGHRLSVTFLDGLCGEVDMTALIASPNAGVFARLRDQDLFRKAFVEHGAIAWPGDLDLAPDAMHAAIKASGVWTIAA